MKKNALLPMCRDYVAIKVCGVSDSDNISELSLNAKNYLKNDHRYMENNDVFDQVECL